MRLKDRLSASTSSYAGLGTLTDRRPTSSDTGQLPSMFKIDRRCCRVRMRACGTSGMAIISREMRQDRRPLSFEIREHFPAGLAGRAARKQGIQSEKILFTACPQLGHVREHDGSRFAEPRCHAVSSAEFQLGETVHAHPDLRIDVEDKDVTSESLY